MKTENLTYSLISLQNKNFNDVCSLCSIEALVNINQVSIPVEEMEKLIAQINEGQHCTASFDDSPSPLILIHAEGKAFCQEGDTFNEKLGMKIARSRAMVALYKALSLIAAGIYRHYVQLLFGKVKITEAGYGPLGMSVSKYLSLYSKERDQLNKLIWED